MRVGLVPQATTPSVRQKRRPESQQNDDFHGMRLMHRAAARLRPRLRSRSHHRDLSCRSSNPLFRFDDKLQTDMYSDNTGEHDVDLMPQIPQQPITGPRPRSQRRYLWARSSALLLKPQLPGCHFRPVKVPAVASWNS